MATTAKTTTRKRASTTNAKATAKAAAPAEATQVGASAVAADSAASTSVGAGDLSSTPADALKSADAGVISPAGLGAEGLGETPPATGEQRPAPGAVEGPGDGEGNGPSEGSDLAGNDAPATDAQAAVMSAVLVNHTPGQHWFKRCRVELEPGESVEVEFRDDAHRTTCLKEVGQLRELFGWAEGAGVFWEPTA